MKKLFRFLKKFTRKAAISIMPFLMTVVLMLFMLKPAESKEVCIYIGPGCFCWICWEETEGKEWTGYYIEAGNIYVVTSTEEVYWVATLKNGTVDRIGDPMMVTGEELDFMKTGKVKEIKTN